MCTPLNSPMENLFFHQFFTNSINNFISNFLFSRALFLFICTYSHLWKLMRICENLFFPVRFFESVFFSAKTYFLKSLWKSASVWTPSSKMYLLLSLLTPHVPILWLLLWILLILFLIIFLLNKMFLYLWKSVAIFARSATLYYFPSSKRIKSIFDFNPTNSWIGFPLYTVFILPITFLLVGSKSLD